MTKVETELKTTLRDFFREKNVQPPITASKLKKAGYEPTPFLIELQERLKKFQHLSIIQDYLEACKRLI